MEIKEREVKILELPNGDKPYSKWFADLRDTKARVAIQGRINRAQNGNFGDHKIFEGGVGEMRVDIGPGYRIYFGIHKNTVIVLIGAGDKKTQDSDINDAKVLWEQYKNEVS